MDRASTAPLNGKSNEAYPNGQDSELLSVPNDVIQASTVRPNRDRTTGNLKAAHAQLPTNTRTVILQGRLGAFSTSSLLSLLNIQKQSGWLTLVNGKEDGAIYVENGEVFHAYIGRASTGPLAIFQLFGWKHGDFYFELGNPPATQRTIEASLPVLQVRATLWLDNMSKYANYVPSTAHRLAIAAEPQSNVIIEPYQWAVLTKIVSRPMSITELATELNQDLISLMKIATELVKSGVATTLPPE